MLLVLARGEVAKVNRRPDPACSQGVYCNVENNRRFAKRAVSCAARCEVAALCGVFPRAVAGKRFPSVVDNRFCFKSKHVCTDLDTDTAVEGKLLPPDGPRCMHYLRAGPALTARYRIGVPGICWCSMSQFQHQNRKKTSFAFVV